MAGPPKLHAKAERSALQLGEKSSSVAASWEGLLSAAAGARHDRNLHIHGPAAAQHIQCRGRPDLGVRYEAPQLRRVIHGLPVEADDDVAGTLAAPVRLSRAFKDFEEWFASRPEPAGKAVAANVSPLLAT